MLHTGKSLPQKNDLHDVTVQFQSYHPHLLFQCSSFLTPLIFCTADLPATALNCVTEVRPDYLHYSIYHLFINYFLHYLHISPKKNSTGIGYSLPDSKMLDI